jgi:membrane-bound metal-dependent hydrolase YbcI (DUF457 family)
MAMAGYKGHIFGSILLALLIYILFSIGAARFELPFFESIARNVPAMAGLLVVVVLFSLFPDIDTNSKGQDIFYLLFLIADLCLLINRSYLYSAILGLLALLPVVGKHRGWTHTIWACLLVPLPFILVPAYFEGKMVFSGMPYYTAAVVGYFSHLLLDNKYH